MLILCKGFFFFLIVFSCHHPKYYPIPDREIENAHSIFRNLHPCKNLAFMRSIARGLPILVRSLKNDNITYSPGQTNINCVKVWLLGTGNTCVMLQSRVRSSCTTVDGLLFWVYFAFLFCYVCLLAFVFCWCCSCFLGFFCSSCCFFPFFILLCLVCFFLLLLLLLLLLLSRRL